MSGINQLVKVTLRNPTDHRDTVEYTIKVYDTALAKDWIIALKELLSKKNLLEKNFCFLGFPKTQRTLEYLCDELNRAVETINYFNYKGEWQRQGLKSYIIEEWFHPNTVRFPNSYPVLIRTDSDIRDEGHPDQQIGLSPKQQTLNRLHNYFEQLQGTVWNLSPYYKLADYETKYAIRQLNILCHEIENLILSQRKSEVMPEWIRPSQITTFLHAERYDLTDEHRELFVKNGYDRHFGHVYMHWTQIGKTLFEVWRDEGAPRLNVGNDPTDISIGNGATCEAITALKHYSGEFDIEWGNSIILNDKYWWHVREQDEFIDWLKNNGLDPSNKQLSLGYLPIGEVELQKSFGTTDAFVIWDILSQHLDIYSIEVDGIKNTFEYCWTDPDYKQQQIDMMRPGYDHSSRG
jgi:hypothetical protein